MTAASISIMLPDTGERFLSTYLCKDLNEGSDNDWLASLETDRSEQRVA